MLLSKTVTFYCDRRKNTKIHSVGKMQIFNIALLVTVF